MTCRIFQKFFVIGSVSFLLGMWMKKDDHDIEEGLYIIGSLLFLIGSFFYFDATQKLVAGAALFLTGSLCFFIPSCFELCPTFIFGEGKNDDSYGSLGSTKV